MPKTRQTNLSIFLIVLSVLLRSSTVYSQGSLTPPGTPTPTMKSLTQIDTHITTAGEKRIDVTTLLVGDGNGLYAITQPGSYYLAHNIDGIVVATPQNVIRIAADNVVLDLNGVEIDGSGFAGPSAIVTSGSVNHIVIRNGTISHMQSDGINLSSAFHCLVENVRAANNGGYGIRVGPDSAVLRCLTDSNGGSAGISVGDSSRVAECVSNGDGTAGIVSGGGCEISHCSVSFSNGVGIMAGSGTTISNSTSSGNANDGIEIAGDSEVVASIAYHNTGRGIVGTGTANRISILHCQVSSNNQTGIVGQDGWTIRDSNISNNCLVSGAGSVAGISLNNASLIAGCTVFGNKFDGIRVSSASTIEHNVVNSNGNGATTAGIHVLAFGNRIDSNEFRDNTTSSARGLKLEIASAHNTVIRNTAGNNGFNYDVSTGNGVGPIISADAGNVGNASNSPFANIQD